MADIIFNAIYDNSEVTKGISNDMKSFDNLAKVAKSSGDAQKKTFKETADGAAAVNEAIKQMPKQVEKVTNSFAQLKKEIKEYKAAALAAGETTPIGQAFIKKAAEATDRLNDLNQSINKIASDTSKLDGLIGGARAIAAGFSLAQGAAGLFGNKSEDLQKSLLKVQSAMAVLNGLTELQNAFQKESAIRILLTTTAQKAAALSTAAFGSATTAALGPIGLIVTILGFAATALSAFSSNTDEAKASLDRIGKSIESVGESIDSKLLRRFGRASEAIAKDLKDVDRNIIKAHDEYVKAFNKKDDDGQQEALKILKQGNDKRKALIEEQRNFQLSEETKIIDDRLTKAKQSGKDALSQLKIQLGQELEEIKKQYQFRNSSDEDNNKFLLARLKVLNDAIKTAQGSANDEIAKINEEADKKAQERALKARQDFIKRYNELMFFAKEKSVDDTRRENEAMEKVVQKTEENLIKIAQDGQKGQEKIDAENLERYKRQLAEKEKLKSDHLLAELKKQQDFNAFAFQTAESFGKAMSDLFIAQADGNQLDLEKASKAVLTLVLDTVEKMMVANVIGATTTATATSFAQPDSVATFGVTGAIRAGILVALITAAFETAKSAIKGIGFHDGGYTGDGNEWREAGVVHKGEFVNTAVTTKKHRPILEALHKDDYSNLTMPDLAPLLEGTGINLMPDLARNAIHSHSVANEIAIAKSDKTAHELMEIKKVIKQHFSKEKPNEIITSDGTRIVKKGSTTRIIKKK